MLDFSLPGASIAIGDIMAMKPEIRVIPAAAKHSNKASIFIGENWMKV